MKSHKIHAIALELERSTKRIKGRVAVVSGAVEAARARLDSLPAGPQLVSAVQSVVFVASRIEAAHGPNPASNALVELACDYQPKLAAFAVASRRAQAAKHAFKAFQGAPTRSKVQPVAVAKSAAGTQVRFMLPGVRV